MFQVISSSSPSCIGIKAVSGELCPINGQQISWQGMVAIFAEQTSTEGISRRSEQRVHFSCC